MNVKQKNALIIIIVTVAAVGVIIVKKKAASRQSVEVTSMPVDKQVNEQAVSNQLTKTFSEAKRLPRLVDLGASRCIPCKLMAPMLEELKKEYKDRLRVDFLDVWKNPKLARQYNIRIIPTQIFYDSNGEELFRHAGFFSKEDILAKWKELGVELAKAK